MAEPPQSPFDGATSFLESLNLGALWSENDWSRWAMLLGSIFVGLLAGRLAAWLLARSAQHCEARNWASRAQVLLSAVGPASLLILTIGLTVGVSGLRMERDLLTFVGRTQLLLYSIAVFWYAYNLVDVIGILVRRLARGIDSALQRHIVLLVSRSLRVFLVVVGTLFVAQSVFEQNIGAWLAGFGIAGLAVSLAAQDSLKHLFASVTILLDRSFHLGDHIISCGFDGTIEDIGFRSTRIRTAAGHEVTIPNANLVNNPIENLSRRPAIRRVVTLLVPGQTPSEKLREAIRSIGGIFDEEGIRGPVRPMIDYSECPPQVRFEDIQAGGFRLTVAYWYSPATDPDYSAHAERVNLRIVEELQKAGVELVQPMPK
jgi:MscS family membrane protein